MNIFDLPRSFVLTCLFVLGSCFGSFLNVCIHRFPPRLRLWDQLRSLSTHSSGCPRCAASIRWHDNIPLLGWLMLRGKCRNCRKPISARYPFVELLTGLLFVFVYQAELPPHRLWNVETSGLFDPNGPQIVKTLWSPEVWLHARYALHMMMICGLIVATFIDLELTIIPDGCTVPVMVVAFVASVSLGQLFIVPLWFQEPSIVNVVRPSAPGWLQPMLFDWDCAAFAIRHPRWHGLLVSIVGFVIGGGVVWIIRIIGARVLRQEAMGFGDVVLMAMVGSVIGWQPVSTALLFGVVMAAFAAVAGWLLKGSRSLPFGPWLSLGTIVLLLTWKTSWPLAERFFDLGPLLLPLSVFMTASLALSLQLVPLIKRMLGIPLYETPTVSPPWTSADHLTFYNSERPDEQTGAWPRPVWPGCRSGRGLRCYQDWRFGK